MFYHKRVKSGVKLETILLNFKKPYPKTFFKVCAHTFTHYYKSFVCILNLAKLAIVQVLSYQYLTYKSGNNICQIINELVLLLSMSSYLDCNYICKFKVFLLILQCKQNSISYLSEFWNNWHNPNFGCLRILILWSKLNHLSQFALLIIRGLKLQ